MKISSTGRYGMRIMLDVALNSGASPAARQDIAERQRVTPNYIAQLARRLAAAGLLKARKGPGGGYLLGAAVADIRLGDILRALDETIAIAPCMESSAVTDCQLAGECAAQVVWCKLAYIIQEYLDTLTLADLLSIDDHIRSRGSEGHEDPFHLIESIMSTRAASSRIFSTFTNRSAVLPGSSSLISQGETHEEVRKIEY